MDSVSRDLTKFEKNLGGFLTLSKTIIQSHERRNLKLSSKRNPILSRLEKYIKTYDRTEVEEHIWCFDKIYSSNRPAILRGPARDNWLKNGNLVIQYGEEVDRVTDIKIHVSSIYNTACKLRDDIEESLQGLPDVDESQELLYPSLYLLHLYKIFFETAGENDGEKLDEYISILEKEAGIKSKGRSSSTADPMGSILGAATDFMGQLGIKLPEGQKMPSQEELGKALGTMMNNPQTKSMMGNVMKEMQECNSLGDVVNKLMSGLGGGSLGDNLDPATKQSIQDNISNASQMFGNDGANDQGGDDFADGDDFIEE